MLEELLKEMAGEFPLLSKIFVEERDLYMTNALHTLLRKSTFDKRVAWSKTDGGAYFVNFLKMSTLCCYTLQNCGRTASFYVDKSW